MIMRPNTKNYFLRQFALLLCVFVSLQVHAKTQVLITVDVESRSNGDPKKNIWGELDGDDERYGVPKIIEIFERNKTIGTFYLDVYDIARHGDKDIMKVAKEVTSKGHDLQLHTHPGPMYEKYGMSLFGLDEQEEILRTGKELIFRWTGKNVIAHRAGAYMGNLDTLRALGKVGLFVDSSLSPASSSPLVKEGHEENDIVMIENILQIPITYYTQLKFMGWESKRFLDIESSSLRELKDVLNQMADQGSCAANIMMHSFSIIRYGYPDERIINKLDSLLKYIQKHPKLDVSSTESFYKSYSQNSLSCNASPHFVPHTGVISTYLRSWERFSDGWKNIAVALGFPSVILLIIMIYAVKRPKRRVQAATAG